MNIIWLGHGSFRIEAAREVLLVDPWLDGNPSFPNERRAEALTGATHILITHGHFDHTVELETIARETGATICGIPELTGPFEDKGLPGIGFNKGGTIMIGQVAVSMVPASHSSSMKTEAGSLYTGTEAGYVLRAEGKTVYLSGDTGIMADMDWIGDFYKPTVGILSAGGHYTMGMKEAAYAANRYFNFNTIIPCHYKTFPLLEHSAQALMDGVKGATVIEPEVLVPIEI